MGLAGAADHHLLVARFLRQSLAPRLVGSCAAGLAVAGPNSLGEPVRDVFWGVKNYVEGGNYLGIMTLLLAVVAVVGAGGRGRVASVQVAGGKLQVAEKDAWEQAEEVQAQRQVSGLQTATC